MILQASPDRIVIPLNLVLSLNGVLWLKYTIERLIMKKARFTETGQSYWLRTALTLGLRESSEHC